MREMQILLTLIVLLSTQVPRDERIKKALIDGARTRLGDAYDSGYYAQGYPPRGKSACVDVLYFACQRVSLDLQSEVDKDIQRRPDLYPSVRDRAINHRWAPNLIVYFRRHWKVLPNDGQWEPGDVVFWSLTDDGVADHCGLVTNPPFVIHQFPPLCAEHPVLLGWKVMGHFRHPEAGSRGAKPKGR